MDTLRDLVVRRLMAKWIEVQPGARLTKAYDVTTQRYRNSHAKIEDSKMHLLRCEFKILCEISKVPFEISRKILNSYTAKLQHFTECWKNSRHTISSSYDIWSLSETGPWVTSLKPGPRLNIRKYVFP